ncbi:MAG: MerR family transcriptional regulator [Steroidobacteraceae bacterium]|nr:MerR family transcriptional regulator [Steroidobacteraceae bacterium]
MSIERRGGLYSIRAAALASGLSVETVRAWERRYGTVQTRRDEAGHRVYTAHDVARLRRLKIATDCGHAIGKIVHAADTDVDRMIADASPALGASAAAQAIASRIIEAAERYDVAGCDQAIATALTLLPLSAVVREIFAPVLGEVGNRWHSGAFAIAQERLVSCAIRRQLTALLNSCACNTATAGAAVVFATISGEMHELGILMHAALAASRRVRTHYLGVDLPPEEIAEFARRARARAVAIGLLMADNRAAGLAQLLRLREVLAPEIELWAGGPGALPDAPSGLPEGIVHMTGPVDFDTRIELLNQSEE